MRKTTAEVKKAFTLAEIMITLVVIGVISAIIMPIAINSVPDENVLKFKKANATLFQVIQELVNSDKYYKDGDLGVKADGTLLDYNNEVFSCGKYGTYFCETIKDVLTTKSANCACYKGPSFFILYNHDINTKVTDCSQEKDTSLLDEQCKNYAYKALKNNNLLITSDDVTYYNVAPNMSFDDNCGECYGSPNAYVVYCIDIDGIPDTVTGTSSECGNECPFGYGIRRDGKIILGPRAKEWLEKDIQGEK